MMRFFLIALVVALTPLTAMGRAPDGVLDVIRTPNEGMPVILKAGETFDATLTGQAPLQLRGSGDAIPLSPQWTANPNGTVSGRCTIPENVAPGEYALEAQRADGVDAVARAVYVVEEFSVDYAFVQLTDCDTAPGESPILRDLIAAINESEAAFAVITGGLTAHGAPEEYQEFLSILSQCQKPTFVCPGTIDGPLYDAYFSARTYTFAYGDDGYLVFDTSGDPPAPDLGTQSGLIQQSRRAIKASRWSVGITHRYDPRMGMRAQLALFVDDPLDHLFFGHWRRASREGEKKVFWATTPMTATPAASDAALRVIQMSPRRIAIQEPSYLAEP
jgi:hypothetical protein